MALYSITTKLLLHLILLILAPTLSDGLRQSSCLGSERLALLEIKSVIADAQTRLASWKGHNCCNWTGIACAGNHVVRLDLRNPSETSDRISTSRVSPFLLHLTHLKYLDLSMNYFDQFQIPAFLGSLANLAYLNLSNAGFSGLLPHALGNLSNLHTLDLSSDRSHLIADDLNWLSSLHSLRYLDMSFVDLYMVKNWLDVVNMIPSLSELYLRMSYLPTIPTTLSHLNLTSLAILDLSHFSLEGPYYPVNNSVSTLIPSWLFELKGLVSLNLASNNFNGTIPVTVGNLTNLQILDLYGNSLTGPFPESVGNLRALQTLYLSENLLDGHIPESVGNLRALQTLDLSENFLRGKIPESVGNLTALRTLYLGPNLFYGTIPESMGNLRELQTLYLGENLFTGTIPESVGNLRALQTLDLSGNSLSGAMPESLGNLTNLLNMYLSGNRISGGIPRSIGNLSNLVVLYLSTNNITGSIPETIGKLNLLEYLVLDSNKFSGKIPQDFFNLSNLNTFGASKNILCFGVSEFMESLSKGKTVSLQDIYLSNNMLTGNLPDNVGEIQTLGVLDLSDNLLDGSVPASIGQIFALEELYLSSNSFTDELTAAHFSNLHILTILNLSSNHLRGGIPENIGTLTSLASLDLSLNELSGQIPYSILFLDSLNFLNLSNNKFLGRIPSGGQLQTFLPSSYSNNIGLCGPPLPIKCPDDRSSEQGADQREEENGDEDSSDTVWIYISFALGFMVGLWGFVGVTMIKKSTSIAYVQFIDKICNSICK